MCIGPQTAAGTSSALADNCIIIGNRAGYYLQTNADHNIFIGYRAGYNTSLTGDENIIIGGRADSGGMLLPSASTSNYISIGNAIFARDATGSGSTPAGKVGIGTNDPSDLFHVQGTVGDLLFEDATGYLGVGTTSPSAVVHVYQSDAAAAVPCLELQQEDEDVEFAEFDGTAGSGGANSLDTSTGESGACGGKIRITVNGTTKWLRYYDDET